MKAKYKIWDPVMLPRFGNYNPKFDRDVYGYVKEIREWKRISYLVGNTRYLEEVLRDMWWTALYSNKYNA